MITDNVYTPLFLGHIMNLSFSPEVYKNLTDILYPDAIKDWKIYNDDGSDPHIARHSNNDR